MIPFLKEETDPCIEIHLKQDKLQFKVAGIVNKSFMSLVNVKYVHVETELKIFLNITSPRIQITWFTSTYQRIHTIFNLEIQNLEVDMIQKESFFSSQDFDLTFNGKQFSFYIML